MPGEPSFDRLRVLSFESRRATELATLIATFGGHPVMAPAFREVPLESNTEAQNFAAALMRGEFDIVVFLTGVGTRTLTKVIEQLHPRDRFIEALARTKVVARGPKPLAVLREVPVWVVAPEPNTWRELLDALDARSGERPVSGARIAVQEYGVSNEELLDALRRRGGLVTPVPIYRWALPEDVEPLRRAASAIARGDVDVAVFTTGVQVGHLWQIVRDLDLEDAVRRGFTRTVIASIGPTTSAELRRHDLQPDLEASPPKIGRLVRLAAERAGALLRAKRGAP